MTVMALDRAGACALLAHVGFLRRSHSEWDKKATEAIENDRRNSGSPDDDRRLLSWNTDEALWIVACCKSNDGTTKARRYRFMKGSEKERNLPITWN